MNKVIKSVLLITSFILYGFYFYGWYKISELHQDPTIRKAEFLKLWYINSMWVVNVLIIIPSIASILLLLVGFSQTTKSKRVLSIVFFLLSVSITCSILESVHLSKQDDFLFKNTNGLYGRRKCLAVP